METEEKELVRTSSWLSVSRCPCETTRGDRGAPRNDEVAEMEMPERRLDDRETVLEISEGGNEFSGELADKSLSWRMLMRETFIC